MTWSITEESQPLTHTCLSGVHPLNSAASGTLLNVFLMPAGSHTVVHSSLCARLQACLQTMTAYEEAQAWLMCNE